MKPCRGKCIKIFIVLIATITPVSATSIDSYAINKSTAPGWASLFSNTINPIVSNSVPSKPSVSLFNTAFDDLLLPQIHISSYLYAPINTAETDLFTDSTSRFSDWLGQENILWPLHNTCDDTLYGNINVKTQEVYSAPTVDIPNSLNLLFWGSVLNREEWNNFPLNANLSIVPEPAPIGFLGISIVGFITIRKHHKK